MREEQEEEAERVRIERLAQEKAARIEAQRIEEERLAQEETARTKARREREGREKRGRALEALRPWREKLRQDGIISEDDDTLYGDAGQLVAEGISSVTYLSDAIAAVALAPDDYAFPDGRTAAELREGITAMQRMKASVFPEGAPRPRKIGERNAFFRSSRRLL